MSHAATRWLSEIDPSAITAGEFRVLFHLCDCHNPSSGCFPSQEYLRDKTGLSNGGLNNALSGLEAKAIIYREKRWDEATKKQLSTRYILGFEGIPSPLSGDGAVSTFQGEPSPLFEQSRLHSTGDKPVKGTSNRTSKRVGASDLFSEEQAPKVDPTEEVLTRFYAIFPKRTDKKYSTPAEIRPRLKAALKKTSAEELIAAAGNYASSPDHKNGEYARKAAYWLRDEEWQKYLTAEINPEKARLGAIVAKAEASVRTAIEENEKYDRIQQQRKARGLQQQGLLA